MSVSFNPFDFKYTHAVVSRVPTSLKEATYRRKDPSTGMFKVEPIDFDKAVEQHNEYILTLRKLGIDVIELQADETLPDSTFVDCIAVICNGTALIARPHLVSRRKEADVIKSLLKKEGLNVVEIKDPVATIDASDVFFTGREFFVGISKRTNIVGAKAVALAFPEYPVAIIKLRKGGFHLKAYVAVAGPDLLAIGSSEAAKDILRQMKEIAEYKKYQVITVPDVHGVNCLYINSTLVHCSRDELFNSAKAFALKIDYPRIELKNREFAKLDRFFTCRSLLFAKHKLCSILLSKYFSKITSVSPPPTHPIAAAVRDGVGGGDGTNNQDQAQKAPAPIHQAVNLNIYANNPVNTQLQQQAIINTTTNNHNKESNTNIKTNGNATNSSANSNTKELVGTAVAPSTSATAGTSTVVVKKANFNFNNNILYPKNEISPENQQKGYRIDL